MTTAWCTQTHLAEVELLVTKGIVIADCGIDEGASAQLCYTPHGWSARKRLGCEPRWRWGCGEHRNKRALFSLCDTCGRALQRADLHLTWTKVPRTCGASLPALPGPALPTEQRLEQYCWRCVCTCTNHHLAWEGEVGGATALANVFLDDAGHNQRSRHAATAGCELAVDVLRRTLAVSTKYSVHTHICDVDTCMTYSTCTRPSGGQETAAGHSLCADPRITARPRGF